MRKEVRGAEEIADAAVAQAARLEAELAAASPLGVAELTAEVRAARAEVRRWALEKKYK